MCIWISPAERTLLLEHLVRSAEEKQLTLQMGYMYRYNPSLQYVVESAKNGKLGTITGIDASFGVCHDARKRRWLGQFPGGMMFFLGCHILDMVLLINGMPDSVHPFNHTSDWNNDGSLDSGLAVLDYPHGACVIRTNATENNGAANRRLIVMGTGGTIEIRPLELPTTLRETLYDEEGTYRWQDGSHGVNPGYMPGRYDAMMLEFAACVRGEMKNPYSGDYEIALQRILLEICR